MCIVRYKFKLTLLKEKDLMSRRRIEAIIKIYLNVDLTELAKDRSFTRK